MSINFYVENSSVFESRQKLYDVCVNDPSSLIGLSIRPTWYGDDYIILGVNVDYDLERVVFKTTGPDIRFALRSVVNSAEIIIISENVNEPV